MSVHQFPTRAKEAEIRAELVEAMQAKPYTVEDALTLPLADLRKLGPYVAASPLLERALRVEVIAGALAGPGRIPLPVAVEALCHLVDELIRPKGAA